MSGPRGRRGVGAASEGERQRPLATLEHVVLTALATYGPHSKYQIAQLAGCSEKDGGFARTIGSLRRAGRISGGDDRMVITSRGLADLGDFDPLPVGHALIAHWLARLNAMEQTILCALLAVWPGSMSDADIAQAIGHSASEADFASALGRLRTLELIHGSRATNTAADELGVIARSERTISGTHSSQ